MINWLLGDPLIACDEWSGNASWDAEGVIIPVQRGVTFDGATGLTRRFFDWAKLEKQPSGFYRVIFLMQEATRYILSLDIEPGKAYPFVRLFGSDDLYRTVIFACDGEVNTPAKIEDIEACYQSALAVCLDQGITNVAVPLLGDEQLINMDKVASAARRVFLRADVNASVFLTQHLMSKVLARR